MRLAVAVMLAGCLSKPPFEPPDNNIAFVTSDERPPMSFGSLAAADELCQTSADRAGLGGHYLAFLSTAAESARARLAATGANGWVRTDGKPFANRLSELFDGTVYYPLRLDENKRDVGELEVATGTDDKGERAENCNDFTSQGQLRFGQSDAGGDLWSSDAVRSGLCDDVMPIYCFGVDLDSSVFVPEVPNARRAFVTNSRYALTGGRAEADAICNMEAGTTSGFAALIATRGMPATDAFMPMADRPWVRRDNVVVATDLRQLQAAINLTFDSGDYVSDYVWTGALYTDWSPGDPQDTCGDWTTPTEMGIMGHSARSGDTHAFHASTGVPCTNRYRLYCAEL